MTTPKSLRLLLVEDNPNDAELLLMGLQDAGYAPEWRRVQTEKDFLAALKDEPDLIVSDYSMPQFNGLRALELARQHGREDVPFILVSASIGEETAVTAIKNGATDYLLKDRLARLGPAVGQALEQSSLRRERRAAIEAVKVAETKYREIFENAVEGIYQTTPEGRFLVVNPAMARIFGYSSTQELIDSISNISEQLYVDPGKRAELQQIMSEKGVIVNLEARVRRKDGSVIWAASNARAVRRPDGQTFYEGTVEDISDRKRTEEQLRVSEERLRQSQKMEAIGTLAGGIAHDFNNIIGAISGYTELAKMAVTDKEVLEYLEAVSQGSRRAADLVRQILTFSRRQEQQQRQPMQLGKVIAESLKLLRAAIPATIDVESSFAEDAPAVLADATQIHQIVMNLGTNAWHAMKDRVGKLSVRLERFVADANVAETQPGMREGVYARLSVSDTGRGMDATTVSRIFEPFFTTKAPGEGTGLGLSVVHGIVQRHDGVITVYSEPGVGAIFHVYLPACMEGVLNESAMAQPLMRGNGEKILFVDDEVPLARLGLKTLTQLGYVVESRTSPLEALDLVRDDPARFDLVITDQTMSGMTGTDLCRRLLEIRPDLPVLLTTGYAPHLTAEQIKGSGIRDLLLKPLAIQTLASAVHRVFRKTGDR